MLYHDSIPKQQHKDSTFPVPEQIKCFLPLYGIGGRGGAASASPFGFETSICCNATFMEPSRRTGEGWRRKSGWAHLGQNQILDRRNVRLETASAPRLCIYNSKFNSWTSLFFSMGKQEKLAWTQPSVTRPNSFQPGEGFHAPDSEGRQSYWLCRCACRYTRWKRCSASIVHVLQKWGWGNNDGEAGRSN